MVAIWDSFLNIGGSTITNFLPPIEETEESLNNQAMELEKFGYSNWNYQDSVLHNQLKEINLEQNSNFKIVKSFCIRGKSLQQMYLYKKQKMESLVAKVKKRIFKYSDDDETTWTELFVSIKYNSETISFSYDTSDGKKLWELYHFLPRLEEEISLSGALCIVYIE